MANRNISALVFRETIMTSLINTASRKAILINVMILALKTRNQQDVSDVGR